MEMMKNRPHTHTEREREKEKEKERDGRVHLLFGCLFSFSSRTRGLATSMRTLLPLNGLPEYWRTAAAASDSMTLSNATQPHATFGAESQRTRQRRCIQTGPPKQKKGRRSGVQRLVTEQSGHVQLHIALSGALAFALLGDHEGTTDGTDVAEKLLQILLLIN
jgi:hypothetical protein